MTKTIIRSYVTVLCLALALTAVLPATASEVTGTLSSDTTSATQIGDTITGSVISDSGGSSSGGSRSSGTRTRNGDNGNNTSRGAVLGATDDLTTITPGFPNAGVDPDGSSVDQSLWSAMLNFFKGIFTF